MRGNRFYIVSFFFAERHIERYRVSLWDLKWYVFLISGHRARPREKRCRSFP